MLFFNDAGLINNKLLLKARFHIPKTYQYVLCVLLLCFVYSSVINFDVFCDLKWAISNDKLKNILFLRVAIHSHYKP